MSPAKRPRARGRWLVVALVLFSVVEVAKAAAIHRGGMETLRKDALDYWEAGGQMASGDWKLVERPVAFRPPGYPAYLAGIRVTAGRWFDAVQAAFVSQIVLVGLTSALTLLFVWQLTRSRGAAVIAILILGTAIARPFYASQMMSETLFIFLLTLLAGTFLWWHRHPGLIRAMATGLVLAACILVKSAAQYLAPIAVLAMLLSATPSRKAGSRFGDAVALLLIVALSVTPWILRNREVFGTTFLTKAGGRSLWLSAFKENCTNLPLEDAGNPATAMARIRGQNLSDGDLRSTWAVYHALRKTGLNELEAEAMMTADAKQAIRKAPQVFARSVLERFGAYWTVTRVIDRGQERYGEKAVGVLGHLKKYYRDASFKALPWIGVAFGACGLLGGLILLCDRRTRGPALFLLGTICYFALITAVGAQPSYRYRMIIDPLLILALCGGFAKLLRLGLFATPVSKPGTAR